MPVRERERTRGRELLASLATSTVDAEEARYAAIAVLRRAVGFERWCWPLTDPASGLSTSGVGEFDFGLAIPRIAALEERGDVAQKPRLLLGRRASVALSAAAGGDLARSARWQECLRPYGIGDELMTACRDRHGCWGSVELMRDEGDPPFDEADTELLHELAPVLGTLLRRGLLHSWRGDAAEGVLPAQATVILGVDLEPVSWTPSFHEWLRLLPVAPGMLPPALYEIGTRALTPPAEATGLPSTVRIRTRSERWAVAEGAPLEGVERGRVAITLREATAAEIFDLLSRTYGFTRRERELVTLVLEGLATKELAQALCISPFTVQDHLKAVFAKAGVRSRRGLVSRLAGRARVEPAGRTGAR
jgi:DNA-binding CsgD family transcriptional regulator